MTIYEALSLVAHYGGRLYKKRNNRPPRSKRYDGVSTGDSVTRHLSIKNISKRTKFTFLIINRQNMAHQLMRP